MTEARLAQETAGDSKSCSKRHQTLTPRFAQASQTHDFCRQPSLALEIATSEKQKLATIPPTQLFLYTRLEKKPDKKLVRII